MKGKSGILAVSSDQIEHDFGSQPREKEAVLAVAARRGQRGLESLAPQKVSSATGRGVGGS